MSSGPEVHLGGDRGKEIEATVVFVDLVKFTSLTDVHGDSAGADAAAALEQLAMDRADPTVRLVKATGDGVLLRVNGPAEGVKVAGELIEGLHAVGLDARAGIDVGSVILRNDDIYGRTVNLAARLAEMADPGTVAVTRPVALARPESRYAASPRGPVVVKGLRDPVELFQIDPCHDHGTSITDPVCGMRLEPESALALPGATHGAKFCSRRCAEIYASDPARYD